MTNDLNNLISKVSLRLYADDTTEYFADNSPMMLEYMINTVHILAELFTSNIPTVKLGKAQALTMVH